jgi:hypothetical protein
MDAILNYIGNRLKEKSTWIGIAAIATAVGAWVTAGSGNWEVLALGIFGALAGVTPDSKPQ